MKTIVVYDDSGNIKSVAFPAEEYAEQLDMEPGPGEQVIHVDSTVFGSETKMLSHEAEDDSAVAKLMMQIVTDYQIVEGKVVKKSEMAE